MKANDEANRCESLLLSSAAKGDLEAFNDLVLKYQDMVYNVTRGILGNADAAQDATQEAFLRAFQHIAGFRGGSFRCWLLRIAANACYDVLRTLRRHPTIPLIPEDDDGNEMDSPLWLADPAATPEKATEDRELSRAIQDGLNALPADFRAVIILADMQELEYSEIAEILRVRIGTVKSRLARARLRLRDYLQGSGELLPAACRRRLGGLGAVNAGSHDSSSPPSCPSHDLGAAENRRSQQSPLPVSG